jgi:hypothetical protein
MKHQLGLNCLGFYEEAVGTISELTIDQGFLMARISEVNLALPLEMEGKLRPLMRTRIGILRTDIPQKEYLVRSIQEESLLIDEISMVGLTLTNAHKEKASA